MKMMFGRESLSRSADAGDSISISNIVGAWLMTGVGGLYGMDGFAGAQEAKINVHIAARRVVLFIPGSRPGPIQARSFAWLE